MYLIYLSACACCCFSVVVSAVNCVCCKSERELDQITKSLGTRLTPIPTREEGGKMRAVVKANSIAMFR